MFISAGFAAVGTVVVLCFLLPEHIHWKLGLFSCSRSKGGYNPSMGEEMLSGPRGRSKRETSSRSHWREFPFCWHMSKADIPMGWWEVVQGKVQCMVWDLIFLRRLFLMASISGGYTGEGQNGVEMALFWLRIVGWCPESLCYRPRSETRRCYVIAQTRLSEHNS